MRIKAIRNGINDLIWKLILLLIIGGIHVTLKHFGIIEQMVDITLFILVTGVGMSMIRSLISMTKCFITGGDYFKEKRRFKFSDMLSKDAVKSFITFISYLFFTTIGFTIFPLFIIIYIYSFFQGTDNNYEVDDFDDEEIPKYKKEIKEKVIKDKNIPQEQKVEEKKYEEPIKEKVELEPKVIKNGKYRLIKYGMGEMKHIPLSEKGYGFKSKSDAYIRGKKEYGTSQKWWIVKDGWPNETVYESWK